MKKEFTPIVMKCNKEQFEAIRPKLEKSGIMIKDLYDEWAIYSYLVNNYSNEPNTITNVCSSGKQANDRVVYGKWDEKVFLEACGIEIEPEYKITKDQILELKELALNSKPASIVEKLQELFPEVLEVELEVGKWYNVKKLQFGSLGFDGFGMYTDEDSNCGLTPDIKGFNFKQVNGEVWRTNGYFSLATDKEVFEALKNEAVERGFEEGIELYIKNIETKTNAFLKTTKTGLFYMYDSTTLNVGNQVIFKDGKWAEIVPTITKEEAEKELGKKIV